MPKFTFIYRGGKPKDAREAAARQDGWNAWFRSLGPRLIDRGAPARSLGIAGASNLSTGVPTTGYSVIDAETEQDAMRIAQSCPIYREGGAVEVAKFVTPRPL